MSLTKGKVRKTDDDLEEIPEVPEGIERDRWDRPLLVPAGGTKAVAYTRASTLGKAIEDTYHLNRWIVRAVVLGMSRREDLVALAAAIPENEGEHRGPLDDIGEEAKTAGGGDKGANIGTALHKLSERADAGEDLSYLAPILHDAMAAYRLQMRVFEVLATETFVACDKVMTAGTFDRVVRLKVDLEFHHPKLGKVVIPAGTILILDLKTGKIESAKYWGATYGVQQAVYAGGDPYDFKLGRRTWEQLLGEGLIPSDEWAILLHVPSDSPQDAGLMVVDLSVGRLMAELCIDIREARKDKRLLNEAWPVKEQLDALEENGVYKVTTLAPEERAGGCANFDLLAAIDHADGEAELTRLFEENEDHWGDEHTEAAKARMAELKEQRQTATAAPTVDPSLVPAAKALDLMAKLRAATSEDEMTELWDANQEDWNDAHTRMVKVRMRELAEAVQA